MEQIKGSELSAEHVGRTGMCSTGRGKFLEIVPMVTTGERAVRMLFFEGTLRERYNNGFVDPEETVELDDE